MAGESVEHAYYLQACSKPYFLPTVLTIWSTRQSNYISDILVLTNIDTKNLISISFFYIWIQVFSWMSTKFLCQSLYAEQCVAPFDL